MHVGEFQQVKLLFPILFFLLTSCALPPAAPPLGPPPGAELLQQRLETLAGAFDSLQGVAKVRVESGGRSFAATQVLLARKPDLLRAETLSPFGNPVLTVAVADGFLYALVPGEGRFLRGAASYHNLQKFTRLPLQLADLVSLLLCEVPVIPGDEGVVTPTEEGWLLTLEGGQGGRQELLFDRDLHLLQSSYFQEEKVVLQVGYGNFGEAGFPGSMSLKTPGEQTEATLDFSEVAVNVPIPEERFRLTPPAGYRIEPLP